jgi:CRP-like cAMP-binding protein
MTDTNQSSVTAKAREKALIGRLQQVAAFAKLSTKHMQVMRKAAKPVPLKEGQTLFAQGDEAAGLFVLMKGAISVRRDGVEVSAVDPVAAVGERSMLTGDPYDEEAVSTTAGLALLIPQAVFVVLFDREQELFNRMSRGIIEDLCEELNRANLDQSQLATRRAELSKLMEEAEHELNDARMIHSMRG